MEAARHGAGAARRDRRRGRGHGPRARGSAPRHQRRLSGWTHPAPIPDVTAFYIQEIGALLFGMVFLFLYRQSRVVYFGLWAIAWVLRFLAAIFGYRAAAHGPHRMAGALRHVRIRFRHRADLGGARRVCFRRGEGLAHGAAADRHPARSSWRWCGPSARWPAWRRTTTTHALVLGFVYFYNFSHAAAPPGTGRARLPLFAAAAGGRVPGACRHLRVSVPHRAARRSGRNYLHHETYYDFVLHCVLAFAAMAMWSESQIDRIRELERRAGPPAPRSQANASTWIASRAC